MICYDTPAIGGDEGRGGRAGTLRRLGTRAAEALGGGAPTATVPEIIKESGPVKLVKKITKKLKGNRANRKAARAANRALPA